MLTIAQRNAWCDTQGGIIHPFMLRPGEIRIVSIAQSLSNICRYGGHCQFYSVAQHCVDGARFLLKAGAETLTALTFLLHDAGEAFPPGDLLAPVARWFPSLRRLKHRQQTAVYVFFLGAEPEARIRAEADAMDRQMLAMEARYLFPNWRRWPGIKGVVLPAGWEDWRGPIKPARGRTHHEIAAAEYLNLFDQLITAWEGERYAQKR